MKNNPLKAYGRVALTGLHSVVHGEPALGAQISMYATARIAERKDYQNHPYVDQVLEFIADTQNLRVQNLSVSVDSQLPIGAGLSSSTGVAAAVIKNVYQHLNLSLSKDQLFELLVGFESKIYPVSGLDQAIISYGGLIRFQKKDGNLTREHLDWGSVKGQQVLLIDSGSSTESTKELVAKVQSLLGKDPKKYQSILSQMGQISQEIIDSVASQTPRFDLWRESHQAFIELEVIGQKGQDLVSKIEAVGGAAKVCGAGGWKTGSGVIIAYHTDMEKLADLAKKSNWIHWIVRLGE